MGHKRWTISISAKQGELISNLMKIETKHQTRDMTASCCVYFVYKRQDCRVLERRHWRLHWRATWSVKEFPHTVWTETTYAMVSIRTWDLVLKIVKKTFDVSLKWLNCSLMAVLSAWPASSVRSERSAMTSSTHIRPKTCLYVLQPSRWLSK